MAVYVGDAAGSFTLPGYSPTGNQMFNAGVINGKVAILVFVNVEMARDWYMVKCMEQHLDSTTASNLMKYYIVYHKSSGNVTFDGFGYTDPGNYDDLLDAILDPSGYGITLQANSLMLKYVYADYNADTGGVKSAYLDPFTGTPGIYVIRSDPGPACMTVDAFHHNSKDSGNEQVSASGSWNVNDLVHFGTAGTWDTYAPTIPTDYTAYPIVYKITQYLLKRTNDLRNTSRIVHVTTPYITNGNAWVTGGTDLTFSFHSKDEVTPGVFDYRPKKAVGACDPGKYLLDGAAGHYQSIDPLTLRLDVRDYLAATATPEAKVVKLNDDLSDHEGQRPAFSPNLSAILDAKGLPFSFEGSAPTFEVLAKDSVVYFRDNLETDFGYPHNGSISCSPDIITRKVPVADRQVEFGDASAGNYYLSVDAEYGSTNYVYLRAYNRGATDAAANSAKGTAYWATGSTLPTPDSWNLIGSTIFDTGIEAARAHLRVAPMINWNNVPVVGHYCFIATLVNFSDDPAVYKDSLKAQMSSIQDYFNVVRSNLRVTWRNFNVVDDDLPPPVPPQPSPNPMPGHRQLPFQFPGLPGKKAIYQLQVSHRLPFDVPVHVDLGDDVLVEMPGWKEMKHQKVANQVRFEAKQKQVLLFPETHNLFAFKKPPMVWLQVPKMPHPFRGRYFLVVRQLWNGREIGRITWVFISSKGSGIPQYHRMYWWQKEKIAEQQKKEEKKAR